ncbi:hypothetical protein C5167_030096 [Papaver somniferum]|nr:hypothetical protein C5167_030096 [Papaver somniferum]
MAEDEGGGGDQVSSRKT